MLVLASCELGRLPEKRFWATHLKGGTRGNPPPVAKQLSSILAPPNKQFTETFNGKSPAIYVGGRRAKIVYDSKSNFG